PGLTDALLGHVPGMLLAAAGERDHRPQSLDADQVVEVPGRELGTAIELARDRLVEVVAEEEAAGAPGPNGQQHGRHGKRRDPAGPPGRASRPSRPGGRRARAAASACGPR